MGISQVLWGSVGSGEGIRESKQLCRGAQGWAWFGGSSCFLNQRWEAPVGSGRFIPPWNRLDPKAQQPLSPGYGPPGGR